MIFQIERYLLEKYVAKHSHYLEGRMLDIGSSGKSRYFGLFKNITGYVSLDYNSEFKPDIVSDAQSMPMIPGCSFDSIFCGMMLDDLPHPEKAIKEFNRVLRVDGVLMITVPAMNLCGGDVNYWRFTPNGIKLLLTENGFEILECEKVGAGVFSVTNQFFNRFIKIGLSLHQRKFLRKIFNILFYISGNLSILVDKLFAGETNGNFFIDIILIARKSGRNENFIR